MDICFKCKCGKELEQLNLEAEYSNMIIRIECCSNCNEEAYQDGYLEGKDEGYDEGYEDANNE